MSPARSATRSQVKKPTDWVHFTLPAPASDIAKSRRSPRAPKPLRAWWDLSVVPSHNQNHECNQPPPPPPRPCEVTTLIEKEEWSDDNQHGVMVSTLGRVQLPSGRITYGAPVSKKRGHMRVDLKHPINKHRKIKVSVHQLVRQTFDDKRIVRRAIANGWVVNHINNDPKDNHISNLEWVTVKGNAEHYYEQIYPQQRRKTLIEWILSGRSTRPLWIVDESGYVRQGKRKLNLYNESDRQWLAEQGVWDEIEELLE